MNLPVKSGNLIIIQFLGDNDHSQEGQACQFGTV